MNAHGKGPAADINVLPMIDVLLVLIVIFLMLQRIRYGADLQLPPPTDAPGESNQIVLELRHDGSLAVNSQPVTGSLLANVLVSIYATRSQKLLFIKADRDRPYREVIHAIDVAKLAGVQVFAMVPRPAKP